VNREELLTDSIFDYSVSEKRLLKKFIIVIGEKKVYELSLKHISYFSANEVSPNANVRLTF
jgi:hypothetical protein